MHVDVSLCAELRALMESECALLSQFREAEGLLKSCVFEKDWQGLEAAMQKMRELAEELDGVEHQRLDAYENLKQAVGEVESAEFYEVVVRLPASERDELAELYRRMKVSAIGVQALTWSIGEHVQTFNSSMHEMLNEIFPHRKGTVYSRNGAKRAAGSHAMVVDQHL